MDVDQIQKALRIVQESLIDGSYGQPEVDIIGITSEAIAIQQQTIESLKCCGNCGHGELKQKGIALNNCQLCKLNHEIDNNDLDINNWTPKELK